MALGRSVVFSVACVLLRRRHSAQTGPICEDYFVNFDHMSLPMNGASDAVFARYCAVYILVDSFCTALSNLDLPLLLLFSIEF